MNAHRLNEEPVLVPMDRMGLVVVAVVAAAVALATVPAAAHPAT